MPSHYFNTSGFFDESGRDVLATPDDANAGAPGRKDFQSGPLGDIDAQIAELEGQIATAMQGGGQGPDYSPFYQSPGYQFRLDEGVKAIDRSASARGKLGSGGLQRELTRYGQGLASQEFNSYANRLSAMAGIGQTATQNSSSLASNAGGQIGQTILAGGTAAASGIVGSSNALSQGYTGAADALSNLQWPTTPNTGGSTNTNSLLRY